MANSGDNEVLISQLEQIFPSWDKESLQTLLLANDNDVERTIDSIFEMDSVPPPQSNNTELKRNEQSSEQVSRLDDEEYARQLQMELDREEAAVIERSSFRQQRQASSGHSMNQAQAQQGEAIPDLGIMKALTGFGDMAKRLVSTTTNTTTKPPSPPTTSNQSNSSGNNADMPNIAPLSIDGGRAVSRSASRDEEIIVFDDNVKKAAPVTANGSAYENKKDK